MAEPAPDDPGRYHSFNLVTFIITYQCPLSCPMCFFACGPEKKGSLPRRLISKTIKQSKDLGVFAVGIAGGEPFLKMPLLRDVIMNTAGHDMMIIVVTNGYWAKTEKETTAILKQLKSKGLRRIQVSLDDQHQNVIPIERVANVVKAARDLNFDDIKILGTSQGNSGNFKYQLFYLQEILDTCLDDVDIIDRPRTSHKYFEDPDQVRYSFQDLEKAEEKKLPIRKPGDCLSELMVDMNGDVYPCCNNFIGRIGNLYETDLISIINDLGNRANFRLIKEGGPLKFAEMLDQSYHTKFTESSYGNWCELFARMFQNEQFRDLLMK